MKEGGKKVGQEREGGERGSEGGSRVKGRGLKEY